MNHSPLESIYLYSGLSHGTGDWSGVICGNFGEAVIGLPECWSGWCATCYCMSPGDGFWTYRDEDSEGNPLVTASEEKHFMEARPGDHLVCPFQCETCTFYKLKGRPANPSSHTDKLLLKFLRQANLDAFWSQRPGTVANYLRIVRQQLEVGSVFGIKMFDRPGPYPVTYDFGTRSALAVLWKSEKPGRHETKQKYSGVRKVRTVNTHLYDVSMKGLRDNLIFKDGKANWVATTTPSESPWHRLFMQGYHTRVGERRKQDMAITIDQMVRIQDMLEARWREAV